MAIQGNYNFKGISLDEAYIKVSRVDYHTTEESQTQLKTAATYNEDGSLKSDAVYENIIVKNHLGTFTAKVYKDKAARDENYYSFIEEIHGNFDVAVNSTAKNPVIQAYTAIKAMDAYKDYTDV